MTWKCRAEQCPELGSRKAPPVTSRIATAFDMDSIILSSPVTVDKRERASERAETDRVTRPSDDDDDKETRAKGKSCRNADIIIF